MNDHPVPPMVVGHRYLVRYRSATHRLDRTAVMVYLGVDADMLQFSARPVAGTQQLPRSWIRAVEPVPADTPAHINKVVPREDRRFVVRRLDGYRRGERRWVVWDTERDAWADDARTSRRDAQDVCDELNAAAAAPHDPAPE